MSNSEYEEIFTLLTSQSGGAEDAVDANLDQRALELLQTLYVNEGPFTAEEMRWAGHELLMRAAAAEVASINSRSDLDLTDIEALQWDWEVGEEMFIQADVDSVPFIPGQAAQPLTNATPRQATLPQKARALLISMIDVVIAPPLPGVQVGAAAASHRVDSRPQVDWQRCFTISWTQDGRPWRLEGRSRDVQAEVALSSPVLGGDVPRFLTWKNPRGESERFAVNTTDDGQLLVEVWLTTALKRARGLGDAADADERVAKVPVVEFSEG